MKINFKIPINFDPVWEPAIKVLEGEVGQLMYMAGYTLEDGTVVHTYKHKITRQYVNLSADGREWVYEEEDDSYSVTSNSTSFKEQP